MPLASLLLRALVPAAVASAARTGDAAALGDFHASLPGYYGVPELETLYTSSVEEAQSFLEAWRGEREFGLYIRVVPCDNKAFFPVRVELLGISRGTRVLLFDLRPYLRVVPTPLPGPIAEFLQGSDRLFYGMDLKRSAGRLAFEFDAVVRCVDYNVRAWDELRLGGGLYSIFNRYVSLDIDLWRPDNLETAAAQARHTYLQWSVAEYFVMFYGPARQDWIVTKTELFEAGPVYLRVAEPQHEWGKAREEWMARKAERAARSISRMLSLWRQRAQTGQESSDRGMVAARAISQAEEGQQDAVVSA